MKAYRLTKCRTNHAEPMWEGYVTHTGLRRFALSLVTGGAPADDRGMEAAAAVLNRLEGGQRVAPRRHDPIFWQADCLGDYFKFCGSTGSTTKEEIERQTRSHQLKEA